MLLRLVLQHLADKDYFDRCKGPVPVTATNPMKLHSKLYKHWVTTYEDWDSLEESDQRKRLRDMLFEMWTTDKEGEVMRPWEEQRRRLCEAGWSTFWLSDHELDILVASVIRTYRARQSSCSKHIHGLTLCSNHI